MISPILSAPVTNKINLTKKILKHMSFGNNSSMAADNEKTDSESKRTSAGKAVAVVMAVVAAAAIVVGAICLSKGAKVLEGKEDASFTDKLKEGWKELTEKKAKNTKETKPNSNEQQTEEPKPAEQKTDKAEKKETKSIEQKPEEIKSEEAKPVGEASKEEIKPVAEAPIEEGVNADAIKFVDEVQSEEKVLPYSVADLVNAVKEKKLAENVNRPDNVSDEAREVLLLNSGKLSKKAAELEQKSVLPSGEEIIYTEPIRPKGIKAESISEAIENAETIESPLVLNIKERLPYEKPEITVIKDEKEEVSILDFYNERKPVEIPEDADLNVDSEIVENKEEGIMSYFNRKNSKILKNNLKYTKEMAENPFKQTVEPRSYIPPKILTPEEMPELFNPKLYKSLEYIPGEWTKKQTIVQKNELGEEIREIFPNKDMSGVEKVIDKLPEYNYQCRCTNYCSDGKTIKNIIEYYPQSGTKCKETSYNKRGKVKEVLEYEQYSKYPIKRTLYYKDGNVKAIFDHSFYDRRLREAQYFDKHGNIEHSVFKTFIYKILNY